MESLSNCHQFFQSRGIPKEFVSFSPEEYMRDYADVLDKRQLVTPEFFMKLQESLLMLHSLVIDGYILQGRNGSGKTGWASTLIREALLLGIDSMMTSFPGLVDEYFNSPNKKLNPDYAHVDILVLDEVGKELQKNTSGAILDRVLLHRHNNGKKTILISNMSIDALVALYGATIQSRLNLYRPIIFPDIDMRRQLPLKSTLQENTILDNGKKTIIIEEEF